MKVVEFIKTGLKLYFLMFLGGLVLLFVIFNSHQKKVNYSTSYLFLKEYIPKDSLWRGEKITSINLQGSYCENLRDEPHKAVYDVIIKHGFDKITYVRYFMEQKNDASSWIVINAKIELQSRIFNECD